MKCIIEFVGMCEGVGEVLCNVDWSSLEEFFLDGSGSFVGSLDMIVKLGLFSVFCKDCVCLFIEGDVICDELVKECVVFVVECVCLMEDVKKFE